MLAHDASRLACRSTRTDAFRRHETRNGAGAVGTLNWRAYREVRCRNFYAMAGRLAGENAGPRKPWLALAEFMTELFQTKELLLYMMR